MKRLNLTLIRKQVMEAVYDAKISTFSDFDSMNGGVFTTVAGQWVRYA